MNDLKGLTRTVLAGAVIALLAGCGSGESAGVEGIVQGNVAVPANGTVTFIELNDLHAHMTAHLDRVLVENADGSRSTQISERGGLARIATVVKAIRAENPNSLLMNIGDTYHGGAEALFSHGNALIAPVNALGVDVGVPGNWDYAYGPSVTWRRYTDSVPAIIQQGSGPMASQEVLQPNYLNLAANVTVTLGRRKGESFLAPTTLTTLGNVSVGIVGITSDIVPMMHPMLAMGLDFAQGEAAYTDIINDNARQLRAQGADMVIVMSELGIHKDRRLADLIDAGSVDVIFSAHTHEATFTPISDSLSGAMVVEAGNDGYLGRMDVTFDQGSIVSRDWTLMPIDARISEDAQMAQLVAAARAPYVDPNLANAPISEMTPGGAIVLNRPISDVVGHSDEVIDRRNSLENSFNRIYADYLRANTPAQVAITPGFRYDGVLAPKGEPLEGDALASGEVTLEDVYRFFPVSYLLATGEISGANFRANMEANLSAVYSPTIFHQGGGWADGYSGLDVELNLAAADGGRISALRYSDTQIPVADNDVLLVAGCQRPFDDAQVLCASPGYANVTTLINNSTGADLTPQALFIQALSGAHLRGGARRDMQDANNTPLWPQGDYYQPLKGVQ